MIRLASDKQGRDSRQRVPTYTIILACVASLTINWFVVVGMNRNIDIKVREEAYRELQQSSTVFADQISNAVNAIDATLRMAGYFLSEDSAHLKTLIEKKVISLEPLVMLTYVDMEGRVVETNTGMDPERTNLDDREGVRLHLDNDMDGLYIGKPLIGRLTDAWVFHMSRKVVNSDGSMRGVIIATVNPYYFACFWDELLKREPMAALDPAVSLYGFDGVIRTGSRHLEQYLTNLSPQTTILTAASTGLSGRFEYSSSTGLRASHFTKMMDKPLIAVASYSIDAITQKVEAEQQKPLLIGSVISGIILLTGSILLAAMNASRKNEKRASAAEIRLASALDAIKDSFAIYDATGRLAAWNKSFSNSFNGNGHAADLTAINAYLRDNAETRGALGAFESKRSNAGGGDMAAPERQNEVKVGDGRWLRVERSQTPIGETVVYGADISESRNREAALIQRTRQVEAQARKMKDLADIAERAAKVKSSFLAAMSHELRTPLNAINGFAQVLRKTAMDEEPRHISKLINQSCRHLLDIVDDILDFTRLEADRVPLHPSRIALRSLMSELIETASILTADKPVKASFFMAPDTPTHILADMRRLKQVLLNLVSNAAKFTERGEIQLIAFMSGDMLRFEVSDSGEGIAPSIGQSIFEPFEQGSFEGKFRSSGTGLGLAISRRLVNLMGGNIGYTSRLGEGATFHVEIPYVSGIAQDPVSSAPAQIEAPLAPQRILIAEDAPSSRMLLRLMLTRAGHQVTDVDNGKKALDALLHNEFDVAILDVQMPIMGGPEAASSLRATRGPGAHPPLIALTAQVLDEEVERIREAGFDMVLGKPFMEEDLEAAIRTVLRAHQKASATPVAAGLYSAVAPELVYDKDA